MDRKMIRPWLKMTSMKPQQGQKVFYYFEHVGVHKGYYEEREYPEEVVGLKGWKMDVFFGDKGYLCDDVTHWMYRYDSDSEYPEEPFDDLTFKEWEQMMYIITNGDVREMERKIDDDQYDQRVIRIHLNVHMTQLIHYRVLRDMNRQ